MRRLDMGVHPRGAGWQREREINRIEQMWDGEPELPHEHHDRLADDDR
ncbi:MAG TPA: hypothetical protein VG474_12035 [Solirubrobacteraceae bacterium]|nr:hypothetical protein [Solirubrobacteraceae bacterium]